MPFSSLRSAISLSSFILISSINLETYHLHVIVDSLSRIPFYYLSQPLRFPTTIYLSSKIYKFPYHNPNLVSFRVWVMSNNGECDMRTFMCKLTCEWWEWQMNGMIFPCDMVMKVPSNFPKLISYLSKLTTHKISPLKESNFSI